MYQTLCEAPNYTETQKDLKVIQKWLKSGSGRPTPKWPEIDEKSDSGPHFESLLSHSWVTWVHSAVGPRESVSSHIRVALRSFCVSALLGARPLHKLNLLSKQVIFQWGPTELRLTNRMLFRKQGGLRTPFKVETLSPVQACLMVGQGRDIPGFTTTKTSTVNPIQHESKQQTRRFERS